MATQLTQQLLLIFSIKISSIRSLFAKIFAALIARKINNWASNPIDTQERVFKKLIKSAISTKFGKDHHFKSINTH